MKSGLGLELGRGGARWIDRSVDGSMHPRGRECNRRSGRNSRSSRAIERRDDDDGRRARARSTTHRTPAAASPGLSRPRGASARRTSRRGRAPGGRARARGARMRRRRGETSLVSRGAVAARSVRTRRDDKAGRTERIGRSRGASRHSARARRARRTPSSRAKKFSFAAETRARRRLARLRGRRRSSRPRSSIVPAADRSIGGRREGAKKKEEIQSDQRRDGVLAARARVAAMVVPLARYLELLVENVLRLRDHGRVEDSSRVAPRLPREARRRVDVHIERIRIPTRGAAQLPRRARAPARRGRGRARLWGRVHVRGRNLGASRGAAAVSRRGGALQVPRRRDGILWSDHGETDCFPYDRVRVVHAVP